MREVTGLEPASWVFNEFYVAAQPADEFWIENQTKIEEDIYPRIGT